ncbi:hypothetical protein F4808DRAFT_463552 [Astrocystis sublimbata]|nr:hypothetical protein F4808DRAFT_463552 [Astrocystis sublimbata]
MAGPQEPQQQAPMEAISDSSVGVVSQQPAVEPQPDMSLRGGEEAGCEICCGLCGPGPPRPPPPAKRIQPPSAASAASAAKPAFQNRASSSSAPPEAGIDKRRARFAEKLEVPGKPRPNTATNGPQSQTKQYLHLPDDAPNGTVVHNIPSQTKQSLPNGATNGKEFYKIPPPTKQPLPNGTANGTEFQPKQSLPNSTPNGTVVHNMPSQTKKSLPNGTTNGKEFQPKQSLPNGTANVKEFHRILSPTKQSEESKLTEPLAVPAPPTPTAKPGVKTRRRMEPFLGPIDEEPGESSKARMYKDMASIRRDLAKRRERKLAIRFLQQASEAQESSKNAATNRAEPLQPTQTIYDQKPAKKAEQSPTPQEPSEMESGKDATPQARASYDPDKPIPSPYQEVLMLSHGEDWAAHDNPESKKEIEEAIARFQEQFCLVLKRPGQSPSVIGPVQSALWQRLYEAIALERQGKINNSMDDTMPGCSASDPGCSASDLKKKGIRRRLAGAARSL